MRGTPLSLPLRTAQQERVVGAAPPALVGAWDICDGAQMTTRKLTSRAMKLLAELRASTQDQEQQGLLEVAMDALLFIDSAGQLYAFEDYPPPVASFATRQEAEEWFKGDKAPSRQAVISIAGEPHLAVYHSNINHRSIYPFSMGIQVEESEP